MRRLKKTFTSFVGGWQREAVQAAIGSERFGKRNRHRDQAAIRAAPLPAAAGRRCDQRTFHAAIVLRFTRVHGHGHFFSVRLESFDDRLAHAARDRAVRLSHLHDQLWPARHARLLSHADVASQRLGPRRVRARAGDPEHPLGPRPAVCRRHRRPLRDHAGVVRGRHILRRRPDPDGVLDVAWDARPRGRRLRRLRSGRLFLLRRARRVRQAPLPGRWRLLAFGAGTAAGWFGQFLYSPLAVSLMDAFGWQTALLSFGVGMLLVLPLSLALATAPAESWQGAASQSLRQALSEAVGNRSYVLLVLGFFTCGFQLAFITVHMPAYLIDRGLSAQVGGWTIAVIGLFNIVGSLASGWLGNLMPKRYILSFIYFARAAAVLAFISFPVTAVSSILFGAVMGLLWLS